MSNTTKNTSRANILAQFVVNNAAALVKMGVKKEAMDAQVSFFKSEGQDSTACSLGMGLVLQYEQPRSSLGCWISKRSKHSIYIKNNDSYSRTCNRNGYGPRNMGRVDAEVVDGKLVLDAAKLMGKIKKCWAEKAEYCAHREEAKNAEAASKATAESNARKVMAALPGAEISRYCDTRVTFKNVDVKLTADGVYVEQQGLAGKELGQMIELLQVAKKVLASK